MSAANKAGARAVLRAITQTPADDWWKSGPPVAAAGEILLGIGKPEKKDVPQETLRFSPRQAEWIAAVLKHSYGSFTQHPQHDDARLEVEIITDKEALLVRNGRAYEVLLARATSELWADAARAARAAVQKAKDGGR